MENTSTDYRQQMMQMWLDFASKMAAAGTPGTGAAPSDMTKQMRDAYFQTLSQYTEQYMRSPQFLEMMKQSTDMAITVRKQTNDFLSEAHRAVGSLARPDMDSLLMAIRRTETRILDKLDEVTSQVSEMERRVEALETGHGKAVRKAK